MKTNFNLTANDFTPGAVSHGWWEPSEGMVANIERGPYKVALYYTDSDINGRPYLSMLITTAVHTVWYDNECTPGDTLVAAVDQLNTLKIEDFYYANSPNINHGDWDSMDPDRSPLPPV